MFCSALLSACCSVADHVCRAAQGAQLHPRSHVTWRLRCGLAIALGPALGPAFAPARAIGPALTQTQGQLQVTLTRQGLPQGALQAVRMLLASDQLYQQHAAADFAKQVDALHEETCLQVC